MAKLNDWPSIFFSLLWQLSNREKKMAEMQLILPNYNGTQIVLHA
jgi:hypothetical protein